MLASTLGRVGDRAATFGFRRWLLLSREIVLRPRTPIRIAGIVALLAYIAIACLSLEFSARTELAERPILIVLGLFAVTFASYVFAARHVFRLNSAEAWREVFLWGLVFRAVIWPSLPIQEVDLYRYVWDGAVCRAGVDPYRFPPLEVVTAAKGTASAVRDPELRRLVETYQDHKGLRQVADQVHFSFLTTPYPPVSQAVFAFAYSLCSSDASEFSFVLTFKAVILFFDIATALVLIAMLRFLGYSPSIVLLYWWCPLVIKEFANSGHLDSIAVFFVTASFYFLMKACFHASKSNDQSHDIGLVPARAPFGNSLISAVLLALGVGAKLFPLVLAPLWAVALFRRKKCEWRVPVMAFCATTIIVCWPMVSRTEFVKQRLAGQQIVSDGIDKPVVKASQSQTPSGIEAFYRYWEINDLLFLFVVENLKPAAEVDQQPPPWFVVTSQSWREANHQAWQSVLQIPADEVAFVLTRRLLGIIFCLVVAGICIGVFRNPTPQCILTGSFLTLAWLWLLGPAQNPWYWTWALPFLAFVRNRAWIAVSGLAFLYYLRFWFEGHFAEQAVLSTPYSGVQFFDFVIPWIEFGPWFLILVVMWVRRDRSSLS